MDEAKRERLKNWLKPGGPPPADSPFRCTAVSPGTGHRCRRWAMRGTIPGLCAIHGGRKQLRSKSGDQLNKKIGRLGPVYRNLLSPTLRALVDNQLQLDPDEQASLLDELALMRTYMCAFVSLYSRAHEAHEAEPTDGNLGKLFAAGTAMSGALQQVADLADKAAKINVKQKERFNLHDMRYVVDSIILIIHEVCGDDGNDIAVKVALAIQERLKLPTGYGESADQGTDLHPADTVAREFDDSIPSSPGDNGNDQHDASADVDDGSDN